MARQVRFRNVPAADVLERIENLKEGQGGATFVETLPPLIDGQPEDGATYTLIATYAT